MDGQIKSTLHERALTCTGGLFDVVDEKEHMVQFQIPSIKTI
jgi:hypothetical protein